MQHTGTHFKNLALTMRKSFVEKILIKSGVSVFSASEFSKILKINPVSARAFLSRNAKRDGSHIIKLKRGIYLFSLNPRFEFEIANKLYQPSYISFETALSHYNIIPEIVYAITSATTKRSKEMVVQNSVYKYNKIKKSLYFGYRPEKFNGRTVLMAEAEKALLDYIYILSLRKGRINERLDITRINSQKLGAYVNYFKKAIKKNRAFISLINKIYG